MTYEITKLVKLSPRRERLFENLKQSMMPASAPDSQGICCLCPTRWTMKADDHKKL